MMRSELQLQFKLEIIPLDSVMFHVSMEIFRKSHVLTVTLTANIVSAREIYISNGIKTA